MLEGKKDDPPPEFVPASRIEITLGCSGCGGEETTHVFSHWRPGPDELDGGQLVYGCSGCGRPAAVRRDRFGSEQRPVGEKKQFAPCNSPRCKGATTLHLSHPAGWMCKRCHFCFEAIQQSLNQASRGKP